MWKSDGKTPTAKDGTESGGKVRAPRNRTITLSDDDTARLKSRLASSLPTARLSLPIEGVVCGDCLAWSNLLPLSHVDLLFLDPPYNLNKSFNGKRFSRTTTPQYAEWLDFVVTQLKPLLRPSATIYICGDWLSSHSIFEVASRHFVVRNRITWEREKGRGARRNWKNASEDIWFCTASDDYYFDVEKVKLRRKVMAPYTSDDGSPKDWIRTANGSFRDTHPSNLWTDVSVPFWSMPENTDHPTQKSEKLLAKLMLASTKPGQFVLDPFAGSGTAVVVAHKLGRKALGIEIDEEYCLLALHRLEVAAEKPAIQGYADGVFWERNTLADRFQSETSLSRGRRKRRCEYSVVDSRSRTTMNGRASKARSAESETTTFDNVVPDADENLTAKSSHA